MKITLILGTRPQIIKSAPLIHLAKKDPKIDLQIVHTGQHYDYVRIKHPLSLEGHSIEYRAFFCQCPNKKRKISCFVLVTQIKNDLLHPNPQLRLLV